MEELQEFLLKKEFEKWLIDNHSLYEDITELYWMIEHFKLMYGIDLKVTFEK